MSETAHAQLIHPSRIPNRWVQLAAGVIAMMAIANLQYAWTLFTTPLKTHFNVTLTAIQWTFALFIALETWLVPFEGYLIDRIGPRLMLGIGGILVGLSWVGSGSAASLHGLYFWYGLGGVGAGVVYGGSIGNALKWFPDQRGLCVGLTAGAYGIGTATTVAPIAKMLKAYGYQHTFIVWGIIQGAVVLVTALFMAKPPAGWAPPNWKAKEAAIRAKVRASVADLTPAQMLRCGSFWIIYLMMTMVAFGGLVVTAQLNPMAKSYHVDKIVIFGGMTALVLAIEVDRILNGLTRPFWGWVSDHIGRENTMFIAFMAEAAAVFALLQLIHKPIWFILLSGFCFFAWGEIFSLFPAITCDLFGKEVGDHELWPGVYGQRPGVHFRGPGRCLAVHPHRLMATRFLGHDLLRRYRRAAGAVLVEAGSGENHCAIQCHGPSGGARLARHQAFCGGCIGVALKNGAEVGRVRFFWQYRRLDTGLFLT